MHTFWFVFWVAFWVLVGFCLLFGCGIGGFGFTGMLVLLVVGVGYVDVSRLWKGTSLWGNPFPEAQKPELKGSWSPSGLQEIIRF